MPDGFDEKKEGRGTFEVNRMNSFDESEILEDIFLYNFFFSS